MGVIGSSGRNNMIRRLIFAGLLLTAACGDAPPQAANAPAPRIVSLDACADQYVLKFADRNHIAALSPDAGKIFSYMRSEAAGLPTVRPHAENVLLLHPDIVVRSYGGGPGAVGFFERAGIKVVQIGYASDLAGVEHVIRTAANDLGAPEKGDAVIAAMNARLDALPHPDERRSVLYLTSRGAVAGAGTLIDELLARAGRKNFQDRPGWGFVSLEKLAYQQPDIVAASFFDAPDLTTDVWTPTRHPLAKRRLAEARIIDLPGAWTACGGWPLIDAIEALAKDAP